MLAREREALRRRTDALQMTLMQSQGQGAVARESSPQAILKKVSRHPVPGQACLDSSYTSASGVLSTDGPSPA